MRGRWLTDENGNLIKDQRTPEQVRARSWSCLARFYLRIGKRYEIEQALRRYEERNGANAARWLRDCMNEERKRSK